MKTLVYNGPGRKSLEDRPKPDIAAATDALVKIIKTTICGTDLHILKGDVPTCAWAHPRPRGRWHRGQSWRRSDRVQARRPRDCLVHLVLQKMRLLPPRYVLALRQWWLGSRQQDRRHPGGIRPHPVCRYQPLSRSGRRQDALVMLSDILPTGFECGVLNGKVKPGSTVAIIGAGSIGSEPCSRPISIRPLRSS